MFAFQEPYDRAGVYGEVLVRRWRNVLGHTLWQYPAELGRDRRFLVMGHGRPGVEAARRALGAAQRRWVGEPGHRDGVIVWGPCCRRTARRGWAARCWCSWVTVPAVEAMLAGAPFVRAGLYAGVEVHDWQFGGRPKLTNCLRCCTYPRLQVSARRSLAGRCRQPR